jgi:hypothetical protein
MRTGAPASRGHLRIRFSLFDTILALGAPIIALALRDAQIVSVDGSVYCLISLAFTLIAYSAFRLHDGVSRFFSVRDFLERGAGGCRRRADDLHRAFHLHPP